MKWQILMTDYGTFYTSRQKERQHDHLPLKFCHRIRTSQEASSEGQKMALQRRFNGHSNLETIIE
jgi:hypothetical protein